SDEIAYWIVEIVGPDVVGRWYAQLFGSLDKLASAVGGARHCQGATLSGGFVHSDISPDARANDIKCVSRYEGRIARARLEKSSCITKHGLCCRPAECVYSQVTRRIR